MTPEHPSKARTETTTETDRGIEQLFSRDWTLAYIVFAAIGVVGILAIATTPVARLLGDSEFTIPSTLHGISAVLYLLVSTMAAYLGYRLYTGQLRATHDLRALAALQAFFSMVTVMFGNWIYVYYRSPGGPRAYFMENSPAIHQIFFEFKEFIALFTLPLAVAAAFLLWRHGDAIVEPQNRRIAQAVAIVLVLAWAYLLLAFGLGAAITKLRSV